MWKCFAGFTDSMSSTFDGAGSGISFCSFGRVCLTFSIINQKPAAFLHTEGTTTRPKTPPIYNGPESIHSFLPSPWLMWNVSLLKESHSKLWAFWTWKPWIHTQNGLHGRHVLHLHSGLRDLFLLLWPCLPNSLYNQPNAGGISSYRREPPQNQKHHQYIIAVSQPMISWLPRGSCEMFHCWVNDSMTF